MKFEKVSDQLIRDGRRETFRNTHMVLLTVLWQLALILAMKCFALLFEVTLVTLVCMYVGETLSTRVIKWWYIVSILVGVKHVWMIWLLLPSDLHKIIQHLLIAHKPKSYICLNRCVICHMLNRILHDHMFVLTRCDSPVSWSIHSCRQSSILHWLVCHVYKVFDNFTPTFIY